LEQWNSMSQEAMLEQEKLRAFSFACGLGELLPAFRAVVEEVRAYWAPDDPPSTVLLGQLGTQFALGFAAFDAGERASVLDRIEDGVRVPGDDYLSTVVATGFLEAFIHRAERDGTWPELRDALRPLSQEFADAYVNDPIFHVRGPMPV